MYQLDINKGDIILTGKYRNKKEVVKSFGHDDKGQPTINGRKILNFRIEKLMPKKKVEESKTMKSSEFKTLISECYKEILDESISDDDMAAAKKIKPQIIKTLKELSDLYTLIDKSLGSLNSPGARAALTGAINDGRPGSSGGGFNLKAALKRIEQYYDR